MVSLNLIAFKLLRDEDFMLQNTVTLTFGLLILKSKGIIYGPWPTKTPIMVSLSLIGLKLLSGQGFYAPEHCDHP